MAKGKGKGKNRKVISKNQVERIARQQAYRLIPKKLSTNEATDWHYHTNTTPWLVIKPATINWGDTQNYLRASDSVFIEKCNGFFNISFSNSTINRVEIRELMGWYKGNTDASQHGTADFNSTRLTTDLPNKMSSWDRDNYFIKHDKKYDMVPQQLYAEDMEDGTTNKAVWKSKNIRLTLPMYRKFRYTDNHEGGATQEVVENTFSAIDEPMGWIPFIALQVRCPDQDFTGSGGANAGPYVDYQFRTTFKDLQ